MIRDRLVCLDLSLDRLAAVEVAEGQVVRWTVHPLTAGSLRGGDPVDRDQLASELRSALAQARISAKKARIAISDDAAVVRVIDIPRIPKRHMAGAIRYLSEIFPLTHFCRAFRLVNMYHAPLAYYAPSLVVLFVGAIVTFLGASFLLRRIEQ